MRHSGRSKASLDAIRHPEVPPENNQPCLRSSFRGLASYDNIVKIRAVQCLHVGHDERLTDPEQAWGRDPEDPADL